MTESELSIAIQGLGHLTGMERTSNVDKVSRQMGTVGTHLKCIEHNEDTCSERYNEYGSQRNLTAGVNADRC